MFSKKVALLKNWILILFAGLTFALFLGDGKQMYVDLFGVLLTVVVAYLALRKPHIRTIPQNIIFGWVLVLGYSLVRCFNSASTADSIYSFVRLAEAYIYFYIFYCYGDLSKIRTFLKASVLLTFVGVIAAGFLITNPTISAQLPGMNLLYPTYGHNHIATLLLFVIPFLTISAIKYHTRAKFILFFFVSFLLLTFARLAYFIITIFFLGVFLKQKHSISSQKFIGILTLSISSVLIVLLLLAKINSTNVTTSGNFITKQIFKSPQLQTNRGEYWDQAFKSIKSNPLWGHGLGSFSLESKKYQSEPNKYSFFAHNSVLEITAELGVIGLLLWLYLFAVIIFEMFRVWHLPNERNNHWYGLALGVLLIAVYSLVEFDLNYWVVWVIFWSSCGLLLSAGNHQNKPNALPKLVLAGNLGLIILFYIVTTVSICISISNIANKEKIAFAIAPYERANATTRIKKTEWPLTKRELGMIQTFYKEDADILYQVSKAYETENDMGLAIRYLEQAIRNDPKNATLHRSLLSLYIKTNDDTKMVSEVMFMTQQLLPQINTASITGEQLSSPAAIDAIKSSQQYLFQPIHSSDYFPKFYYFVGLKLADKNPDLTRQLWTLARDIKPSWSYYHIELASLEKYIFKDEVEASRLLEYCKQDPAAKGYCTLVGKDLHTDNFPKVASLQKEIQKIPQYSN